MDEVIWIELLSRHHEVLSRHRCAGPEVRIGRAYDNDVVLDDPYVAPRHLRIRRDATGALVAEDLGSLKGLFVPGNRKPVKQVALDGDGILRVGHTWLRARQAGHAVAPERVEARQARAWPVAAALVIVILGLEVLGLYLNEIAETKLTRYLVPLLTGVMLLLGWVASWAVLARIFAGQARFERNLVIALTGALTYSLYNELVDLSVFGFAWRPLVTYQYIGAWVLLAGTCFFHLRELGPGWWKAKLGAVAALALVAILMQTSGQSELFGSRDREAPTRRLLPPSFRLSPGHSVDAFFGDVSGLKARLDRDRDRARLPGWFDSMLEDDE
jgi:hypothetical protein